MRRISILLFTSVTFLVSAAWPQSDAPKKEPTIITFDPSGSIYTVVEDINPVGAIVGWYIDASNVAHGFVRATDGTITTFDVPGAGIFATQGTSINPAGAIAGFYADTSSHGFLRAPDGTITKFDAPGAGTNGNTFQGTYALNINPAGAIAGNYSDDVNVYHLFLRAPDGTITTFDAPGAGTGFAQGTFTALGDGLNPAGAIAVEYVNSGNVLFGTRVYRGAVLAPDGTFTEFDVPGAGTGPGQGTDSGGINPTGTSLGVYVDSSGVNHGFVRAKNGTITKFDVPGAGTGPGQGTFGESINTPGDVNGFYIDGSGVYHGFVRSKQGDIITFDVPGAGTASGQGTVGAAINPAGANAGTYIDASGVQHGFLRK